MIMTLLLLAETTISGVQVFKVIIYLVLMILVISLALILTLLVVCKDEEVTQDLEYLGNGLYGPAGAGFGVTINVRFPNGKIIRFGSNEYNEAIKEFNRVTTQ